MLTWQHRKHRPLPKNDSGCSIYTLTHLIAKTSLSAPHLSSSTKHLQIQAPAKPPDTRGSSLLTFPATRQHLVPSSRPTSPSSLCLSSFLAPRRDKSQPRQGFPRIRGSCSCAGTSWTLPSFGCGWVSKVALRAVAAPGTGHTLCSPEPDALAEEEESRVGKKGQSSRFSSCPGDACSSQLKGSAQGAGKGGQGQQGLGIPPAGQHLYSLGFTARRVPVPRTTL